MSATSPDRAALSRLRATLLLAAAVAMLALSAGSALAGKRSSANTLKFGMRGTAVKELQRKLHVRPVSGYFGPKTRSAVKRFQRRHHLKATGVAGPKTLRRLGMSVNSAGSDSGGTAPSSGGGSRVKVPRILQKIAKCESGGNPRAVSPSGKYRGKYQFDQQTWEAYGGHGDPIDASESTQDRVAIRLYKARGTKPWPNCA
jgi:peptidoglycan hydrolase-like protein with peptidoglycan-binding domain